MDSAADTLSPAQSAAGQALTALEVAIIDLFVGAVKVLGVPKSIGEIYGLLYASPEPLSLDDLVRRLRMSKGSASQGLKVLRALGAVKSVYVPADRRDHYEAVIELKQLVAGFIREELRPRLETGEQRLGKLKEISAAETSGPHAEFFRYRVSKLEQWGNRGRHILPILGGLIE